MQTIRTVALTIVLLPAIVVSAHGQEKTTLKSPLTAEQQDAWRKTVAAYDYVGIAKAYADYMIEHGRDDYGKVHSPLFVTVLNRKTGKPFKAPYPHVIAKPYAPGLRRDHKMRPYDRTYEGSNPLQDLPLYGLLYRLTEMTGEPRYAAEADKSIAWFLANTQAGSGLYPWGSHMYYHVEQDQGVYSDGRYGGHEYNYVWPYWDQNPEALKRFAYGIWNHHIRDHKTGHFNRHSDDEKKGMEFPQTGSCYMDIWAREYGRSGDAEMKKAIETLLKLFRSMRDPKTGAMAWCTAEGADRREVASVGMNLFMATTLQDAAALIEKRDPDLAEDMRKFVRFMDDEYLSNDYGKILDVAGKGILAWYSLADRTCMAKGLTPPPAGADPSVGFPLKTPDGKPAASLYYLTPWFPGRSYAETALLLRDRHQRCEPKHKPTYRRALLDIADIYMTIGPEVQFAQYPDNIADVVALLRYCHKLTGNVAYLHRADQMMLLGLRLFFDDTSPLPKMSNFDDWYESSLKNESSVAILRQMFELSLDLDALPEAQRAAPRVLAEERNGAWHARLKDSTDGTLFRYGPENRRELFLSQSKTADARHICLSDAITRIPTAAEADELNGRMTRFTGKGHTTANIAYGGVKDVPRQVELVLRNTGRSAAKVRVTATLHDTYHDNGQEQCEKTLQPGEQQSFTLTAPARKWIRRLSITGGTGHSALQLESLGLVMTPRSELGPAPPAPFGRAQPKQITDGLVLQLSADTVEPSAEGSAVGRWESQVEPELVATAEADHRPALVGEDRSAVLRFDGRDDFLTIADHDALDLKAWTLIAVVRAERGPGVILGKIDERNFMMNYRLQIDSDGKVGAVVRGASAKQQVNRQARVNVLNRFAVITARFDPKATGTEQITITVDGQPATYSYENAEGELTVLTHDRPLLIGRQPGREARHFKGDLAGILLYNRALSDDDMNSAARWLYEQRPRGGKKR